MHCFLDMLKGTREAIHKKLKKAIASDTRAGTKKAINKPIGFMKSGTRKSSRMSWRPFILFRQALQMKIKIRTEMMIPFPVSLETA